MLSAKEAAAAVGMTKAGIIRAIHTGKLSATRNTNGQFEIDPAELFRVYDPVATTDNSIPEIDDNASVEQLESFRQQVSMLERIVRDKDETIEDLRQRLDQSQTQVTQLTAIVANLTPSPVQRRGNWWQRLLGGSE